MIRILSRVQWLLPPALLLLLASCSSTVITPSITLSASKTQVTTPETITLTATLPSQTTPTRVEFYEGNTKLGEDTTRPFQQPVAYTPQHNGTHTYTARAILNPNSTLTSDPVQVNVNINATITQVTVQATSSTVLVGQSTNLTATVTGTGSFNSAVTWEILEGGGTLSANTGATVTYTAPQGATTVKVKATSVQDPSKSATVTLQVVPASNPLISIEGPLQVVAGQQATFQGKYLNFEVSRDVTWKVLQGPGQITEKGIYSSLPEATGTVQLLVSSKVKPEISRGVSFVLQDAATPIQHRVIQSSPQLVVALNSTYSITEVKVEIPEVNHSGVLTFSSNAYTESGNPRPGYVGTLPLESMPEGEHVLKLTSTDTRGNVVIQDFIFVVNRPPKVIPVNRMESRNMAADEDGTFHLKVACTDESSSCQLILQRWGDVPFYFHDIARSLNELEQILHINDPNTLDCYRIFATDLYGATIPLVPPMVGSLGTDDLIDAVCFSLFPVNLKVAYQFPGRITDVKRNKVVSVNDITQDSLSIFENLENERRFETTHKISFYSMGPPTAFVRGDGAAYTQMIESRELGLAFSIYDASNNALLAENASSMYASEDLMVWREAGEFGPWPTYYKSLNNPDKTPLLEVQNGSFSSNGDSFAFLNDGKVHLLKNNQVTQITSVSSHLPRVDGENVLYYVGGNSGGLYLWNNGQTTLISSKPYIESNSSTSYLIRGNHIAYMETDATNRLQVWVYTIGGEKRQVTNATQTGYLRALAEDGRVAILKSTLHVQDVNGVFQNTGLEYSPIVFMNNDWYFPFRNVLLKLE